MFYRCTKVQHKPINIQVRDQIQRSKETWVCYGLAHQTVSGAPGPYRVEPATLGLPQACSSIIHRTVRCAIGAMAKSCNGRLQKRLTEEQCAQSQSRRVRGPPDSEQDMSGEAPDYPVPQEDNDANGRLLQNPNGWVMWRRTGQPTVPVRWHIGLSGAPIANNLPQRLLGGWGL
jgi:hypothetical protein